MTYVKAEIRGIGEVAKRIRGMGERGSSALAGALYAEALHIMADSVPRTPLITSRLRNSQFVTHPRKSKIPRLHFGYGVKYAYRVHEGIKTRVRELPRAAQKAFWASTLKDGTWKKSTQGGPKYLEKAVDATAGGRRDRVDATTKRYFERGIGVLADPSMAKTSTQARRKAASIKSKETV